MALKLYDTAEPAGDFEVCKASDVSITINGTSKRLQTAYDDGDFKGSSSGSSSGTSSSTTAIGELVSYFYSTETECKTNDIWIDNKPVYVLVYKIDSITVSEGVTDTAFGANEFTKRSCVKAECTFTYDSKTIVNGLCYRNSDSFIESEIYFDNSGNGHFVVSASSDMAKEITNLSISVYYTKTESVGRYTSYVGGIDEDHDWTQDEELDSLVRQFPISVTSDDEYGLIGKTYYVTLSGEHNCLCFAYPSEWLWGDIMHGSEVLNSVTEGTFYYKLANGEQVLYTIVHILDKDYEYIHDIENFEISFTEPEEAGE